MYYPTANDWRAAPHKRVVLFAMSGLGKTHVSSMLRQTGHWFHYSIDYRIGTGVFFSKNVSRTKINDAVTLNEHRAIFHHAALCIHRDHGGISYQ